MLAGGEGGAGPAALVPAESRTGASWTAVCYQSVRLGDQMAPGDMAALASVRRGRAAGRPWRRQSSPKLMAADCVSSLRRRKFSAGMSPGLAGKPRMQEPIL